MDIVSDVLEPMGLPLVNAYFTVKDNVFLNFADDKAKGFEAIGNWFLTPARHLFGGKKVSQMNLTSGTCKIRDNFKYDSPIPLELCKTALTVLLLAPSLLIGSAFKGLAYISSDMRKKHAVITDTYTMKGKLEDNIAANRAKYLQQGFDLAVEDTFQNPSPTPKPKVDDPDLPAPIKAKLQSQQKDIQSLKAIGTALTEGGIPWWVDFGTLLGAYRHHGMIPWDLDVDIAILAPDHETALNLLKQKLPKDKFEIWDFSPPSNRGSLVKVRSKETNMLFDVYHYTIAETASGDKSLTYNFSHKKEWYIPKEMLKREPEHSYAQDVVFPLKKADFEGVEVFVPNKIEDYLVTKYSTPEKSNGEPKTKEEQIADLKPCRVWDSKKKDYVKVPDHPYWKASEMNY